MGGRHQCFTPAATHPPVHSQLLFNPRSVSRAPPSQQSCREDIFSRFLSLGSESEREIKAAKKREKFTFRTARVEILFATYACPVLLCGFTLEENIKGKEIKNSWRVRGMRFEKWERTQDYNEKRSSSNLNLISPATPVCLRARCGSLSFATLFN